MAAPNIVNVISITGKTALINVTTVASNVIVNAASSGTVIKLNTIMLSNKTATAVGSNVTIIRSATTNHIGGSISIPANSLLTVLAKDTTIYLEEGDILQADVTVNSAITLTASYEIIS